MKKIALIFVIFSFFLIGIVIGGTNNKSSELFENSLDEFEEKIVTRDNDYEPKNQKQTENILTKIAKKIEELIKKISDKLSVFLKL